MMNRIILGKLQNSGVILLPQYVYQMHFSLFPTSVYENRRNTLQKNVGSGLIILCGNEETGMNYKDNIYPFRQDSCFLYYFGLPLAGLSAIIDTDRQQTIIFGNELSLDDVIWTGPLPSLKALSAAVGVDTTHPVKSIDQYIQQAKTTGREIHFLPPYRAENLLKLAEWLQLPAAAVLQQFSVPLIKAIVSQRSVKEAVELDAIEEAVCISEDMHLAAIKYAVAGMKEYEVAARVQEVAVAAGGRLAYSTILTTEGQVLHNHYYGHTLKPGQLLLVDAGAEQQLFYAGDLTRTFPVGHRFSQQQREVYDIVYTALEKAAALLQPGVRFIDVHRQAAEALLCGLKTIGLVKGDIATAVELGVHTLFFQCGLGHMMGLDVHDMEDLGEAYVGYDDQLKKSTDFGWKSLRLGRQLQPGFVLTVEPGVYMIPELIDRWTAEKKHEDFINYTALAAYRNFGGIRIENNYHITTDGAKKFGKYLPSTATEIETIRQQYL
jgi:Xaa-Pro aminopeptidase